MQTLCGLLALLIWSFSALFATLLRPLPPFEFLGITLGLGFLVNSINFRRRCQGETLGTLVIGSTLIFLSQAGYILAFHEIAPAQVDLLCYLWPLIVIACSPSSWSALIGALMGFIGLSFLDWSMASSWKGIALTLLSMLAWSGYMLLSTRGKLKKIDIYCGPSALLCWALHFIFERWESPTTNEWLVLIIMGVGSIGLAFRLWDQGIRYGHNEFLSLISYVTPLTSIGWLILGNQTSPTPELGIATALVIVGAFLPTTIKYGFRYRPTSDGLDSHNL